MPCRDRIIATIDAFGMKLFTFGLPGNLPNLGTLGKKRTKARRPRLQQNLASFLSEKQPGPEATKGKGRKSRHGYDHQLNVQTTQDHSGYSHPDQQYTGPPADQKKREQAETFLHQAQLGGVRLHAVQLGGCGAGVG